MQIGLKSLQNLESRSHSQEIFESVCNMILDLDPNIRFVGVINNKGKLLTGSVKKGIRTFIGPQDQEMLLMETALGVRMRKEHDPQLGPVNFTVSYGHKMVSMNFPLEDEILCVSAEKKIDLVAIPFLILQLLETELRKKED
ncbi:MAG: hypothetical protein KGH87_03280 [Thaumarchaeota archaeon]|nr:hypothetical protein [Nitrososphaerota archaeon]MDE1838923.1 hypothetical protein [Nitrososphaerota archaeon]